MSSDRSNHAVPLEEIEQHGQHVDAVFILTNGEIIAVHDWYSCDKSATYKVYSACEKFHIDRSDVEQIATARHLREVVLDA